ncbi:hypothetical protein [Thermus thermophilus]|uniref:hypothetical protein n=1 Tax=Thermus thermophilus TaxID=274 RepID=UPI0015622BA3|nr:hypothetical protein [Thermus thermophilus]
MRTVGAVLEVHGVQGAWNMAGNRLPPEELARLLEALRHVANVRPGVEWSPLGGPG